LSAASIALAATVLCGRADAQDPAAAAPQPEWSVDASAAWYFLPDEPDFLQPTLRVDRGRLHLEGRYNYEDRESLSFFVGANFELGEETTLSLTPMIGGLVGGTDGIVPGLAVDLSVWRLEAYAEAEYVFDLEDSSSKFFYMWSELGLWLTDWLRAGMVAQRTRVYQTERDIQRGLLLGLSHSRLEGSFYLFNPGADDQFAVLSLGLSF
jgi:hypothetical protein